MKKLVAVSFLASTLAMAHAAEYAPQEFDFSELGTVQSVGAAEPETRVCEPSHQSHRTLQGGDEST